MKGRPRPSPASSWLQPTKLLVGMLGLALGFMVFFTAEHKERISAALRKDHASHAKNAESANGVEHRRAAQAQTVTPQSDPCAAELILPNTELWGPVVTPGFNPTTGKGLKAKDARECCQACQKAKGCNRWVFCHNAQVCQNQCWLKRVSGRSENEVHDTGKSAAWTSGVMHKDYDVDPATLPPVNASINMLVLTTSYGQIRITLKPEWSLGSVMFVRRLAAMPQLCSSACQFYRAEPGFLLQGSLRAFIPPNTETKPGPKVMERGEIGWAGGSSGPDWFIYLGDRPATHFGTSHTVWGVVADEASLQVVERIVKLPATAPKPGDMHMLDSTVDFTTGAL